MNRLLGSGRLPSAARTPPQSSVTRAGLRCNSNMQNNTGPLAPPKPPCTPPTATNLAAGELQHAIRGADAATIFGHACTTPL
ncbi:hypothetical protein PF003_g2952 [Phytophthora fragariae]|nr:hypothetical protein PF003_g2952 [Phytophthora fragariae]